MYARFVAKNQQSRRCKPSFAIELGVRRNEQAPDLTAVGASRRALLCGPFAANLSALFTNLAGTRHVGQKRLSSTDHLVSPSISISATPVRGRLHRCKINAQRVPEKAPQFLVLKRYMCLSLVASRPLGLNGYHFSGLDFTKSRSEAGWVPRLGKKRSATPTARRLQLLNLRRIWSEVSGSRRAAHCSR